MLAKKLMGSTAGEKKLYVDDVFSTYLYTGNSSTQTLNNGIDLAGEGGLVWTKSRSNALANALFDTTRGANNLLISNATNGNQTTPTDQLTTFNSNGFTLGADATNAVVNYSPYTYASWTFRRAKKFFDIVTYTGNGTSNRQIAHDLGAEPGFITTKSTGTTGNWNSYHRSATGDLVINSTAAQAGSRAIITAANSSTFTVSGVANTNGVAYVAYLWAHDDSEDGIIQCGSCVDGTRVELGFEPQYVLFKRTNNDSDWVVVDSMRGLNLSSTASIFANSSAAEGIYNPSIVFPDATGFNIKGFGGVGATYIYLAIRRPNKPPESGTEVFQARTRSGTGSATTYSAYVLVDSLWTAFRAQLYGGVVTPYDRLRGNRRNLTTSSTGGENNAFNDADPQVDFIGTGSQTLISFPSDDWNNSGQDFVDWIFRRAPGFFDVVCYTGTGANKTEAHNLGKQPELWLVKRRNAAGSWVWGSTLLNANEKIVMPSVNGRVTDATAWNSTYPTDSNISLGTLADVNASGGTYTLYMWATLAGISKVGTYTGNGTSQTIDCGFTTGARFIMIIRMTASTAQDIYLWDSARGIVAGNDPRLSLNITTAEVTGLDTIDPHPSGFIVNQDASNVNVSGAQYLYLSIS